MRIFLGIVFCFFSFRSLWAQDCGELFQKISQIPNALETITQLKELYTPSPEDSSNQVQLRKSATLNALKELNSKLRGQGVAISPREFVSLFPYLEKEKAQNSKPKTKPETSKPIEIPKEIREGEKRVALMPDVINKLTRLGYEVIIESGAGVDAQFSDAQFTAAGATVRSGNVISDSDIVASIQPLTPDQMKSLKKGAVTVSFLSPTTQAESIDAAASAGVTAFSMELIPRISRAQSMDALTSQALCAGYRASLVAADLSPRFFPMLMTAAGTVTPAVVLICLPASAATKV